MFSFSVFISCKISYTFYQKMDFNIQVRKKQLLNLEQFIFTSKDKVHSILDCLQWNEKEVLKEKSLVNCPLDVNHKILEKSVSSHTEMCYLKREGYAIKDNFLSEPLHDPQASIYIENVEKMAIFNDASMRIPEFRRAWNGRDRDPKTVSRLLSTFSSDERAVLYNNVISRTKGPKPPPEFNLYDPNDGVENGGAVLTEEELLMRKRDARRRRIKYKAVHTNKKSYKEVLREVIDGQMDLYVDWLRDKKTTTTSSEQQCKSPPEDGLDNNERNNNRSLTPERTLYDYPCDNSLTSRGSNHSESSKSFERHQRRRKYERSGKHDRELRGRDEFYEGEEGEEFAGENGSRGRRRSSSKVKNDRYDGRRRHESYHRRSKSKGRYKEPHHHYYEDKYKGGRRYRSRSGSRHVSSSSSSVKRHRHHGRDH